jgi:hypothetical protein
MRGAWRVARGAGRVCVARGGAGLDEPARRNEGRRMCTRLLRLYIRRQTFLVEGVLRSVGKGYVKADGEQAGEVIGPKLQGNGWT